MKDLKAGEKLRKYRHKAGLTLRKLSELTGIPFTTLDSYETGRVRLKGNTQSKLAEFFGLAPEDLEDDNEVTERKEEYRHLLHDLLIDMTYEIPVYVSNSLDGPPIDRINVPREIARKIDIIIKSRNLTLLEEGIVNGTLMFVRKTQYPEKGDIILVEKNGDLMITKFEGETGENPPGKSYQLFNMRDIFGVVLYLFREIKKT
ncbi:MAG: helix-turn-helix domain-containing protein [Caldisericaceae bacterium]